MNHQPPIVLAFVLCDEVWSDPITRKKTILGVFAGVAGLNLPIVIPRLTVYLTLTEIVGNFDLSVRLVDLLEQRPPIAVVSEKETAPDPRLVFDSVIRFDNISLPEAGEYRVQLLVNGDLVMERKLFAALIEKK